MATVKDNAFPGAIVDKRLSNWNRTNAGEPNGSITPQYMGEIILDTTNDTLWRATSPTLNNSWVTLTTPF